MRKIELFTIDGKKIGEFDSLSTVKRMFDKLPSNVDPQSIRNELIYLLNSLTDQYFYTEAKNRGGYKNMGEIYVDAQAGDEDAQFLFKLYDAVWKKEEELEQKLQNMTLEELLNLDLQKWTFSQYDQIKSSLDNTNN